MSLHESAKDELSPVKRALIELREMRSRLQAFEHQRTEPIAIIGMGCRFPGGVRDPEGYWSLLRAGVDAITEIPADRWNVDAYYDSAVDAPGKMATRWGGFVDGIDQFDANFFNISPREAITMDPQQRLLLEVAWEALERACQAPDRLNNSAVGVFVGLSTNDYGNIQLKNGDAADIDVYFGTGGAHSVAAGRLSYILGLRGPSIAVDTACSSSLVAIHLACQSLRAQECRMALAGGVNVILLPELTVALSKARMMASNGRCKTFDDAADGFVRSEGCGIVVLKRLSDALADGDTVMAVIRGSAVNQDGRSSGLTAPNGPSQTAVIRAALSNGGVDARDIQYVEAHGTGTSLGDPIEAQALAAALGEARPAADPFLLGSVKTNIGHMEAAAGVGGLMKVVLSLQHCEIPAHLHLRNLSRHIPWQQIPAIIPTAATAWRVGSKPRRAGVSSFGFGGTNAHAVVEEAPAGELPKLPARPVELLTLSAKTAAALQTLAGSYLKCLGETRYDFADVCYSVNSGRAAFGHRLALVAESAAEARDRLAPFAETGLASPSERFVTGVGPQSEEPGVVFLFSGQESLDGGISRALYDSEPVFRRTIDECAEVLRPLLDRSLPEILFPNNGEEGLLKQPVYAQPALFALEYSLAQLWLSWGVRPVASMGHGLGEFAAACVAGVFSCEDGLRLIVEHARLTQTLADDGTMMTVFADEATVRAVILPHAKDISVAALNTPGNIVISGRRSANALIATKFETMGVQTCNMAASHAFYCPVMDSMPGTFERAAESVRYSEPRMPLVSTVTGDFARPGEMAAAAYWARHFRQTVRFRGGLDALARRGHRVFLEIGPASILIAFGAGCLSDGAVWLPSLGSNGDGVTQMINSLAALYANGISVNWAGVYEGRKQRKVVLPTYPFQRERYWHDTVKPATTRARTAAHWNQVIDAGTRASKTGPLDLRLDTYRSRWAALDRLTVEHMLSSLRALKAFAVPSEALTVDELIDKCGILPTYRHLMTRWLIRLKAENQVLCGEHDRYISHDGLRAPRVDEAWREALRLNSDTPELMDYLGRCGELLIRVLTGRESPLETIFPGGDFATAEFLYERWALTRYFNGIAAAFAQTVAASYPQDRPLRVIEIGAGTGGMTSGLLPALAATGVTYFFTDMSEMFLARAVRKFAAYPFVQYGLLDIEQPPVKQGYQERGFDLVVAANSVHATKDVKAALANIRSLLAPGGILLLYEVTDHLPWFEMSVGLIEGWERFADDIRGEDPLLKPAQWVRLMTESGFTNAEYLPETGAPAEVLGHHILIARIPGEMGAESAHIPNDRVGQPVALRTDDPQAVASVQESPLLGKQLGEAGDEERLDLLVDYVREHVSDVLRLAKGRTADRRQRLMDLGIDSLMAVELRNSLGRGLQLPRPLAATLMFDHPTIEAVAKLLAHEWSAANLVSPNPVVQSNTEVSPDRQSSRTREVAELSDEEVERLLLQKLGSR